MEGSAAVDDEPIEIADAAAGAMVSTMTGDVRIRHAAGYAKASTMIGDMRLDTSMAGSR